jgi:hypothetical protein
MISRSGVGAGNFAPLALNPLVDHRLLEYDFAATDTRQQITSCIHSQLPGSYHIQGDRFRIGSRRHNKVVFQPALIAIKNQVHARINIRAYLTRAKEGTLVRRVAGSSPTK